VLLPPPQKIAGLLAGCYCLVVFTEYLVSISCVLWQACQPEVEAAQFWLEYFDAGRDWVEKEMEVDYIFEVSKWRRMRLWRWVEEGNRRREMEKSLRGNSRDILTDCIMSKLEDLMKWRSWHKASSAACNEKVKI